MQHDSSNEPAPDKPLAGGFFDVHRQVIARKAHTQAASRSSAKEVEPLTVSQLSRLIDRAILAGTPDVVLVKGELSNFKPHAASGHQYFTLKDAGACIDCVMWRDDVARLRFRPEPGMELLAVGRVKAYVERGKYQLYVNSLRPLGQGALELAFRQLKEKLEQEGLFATERKKRLPKYPSRIVLITSRQTAALQDMLKVLRRYDWLKLRLYHVPVQGAAAARDIAIAIRHLEYLHKKDGSIAGDVILLGRGGGSLEDMWCFNDEAVARAIAMSSIPIVTGIGHEVDTSIADLVADYHAHTPTEAAQVVVQHWKVAEFTLGETHTRLARGVRAVAQNARRLLTAIERHETFRRPLHRVQSLRQLLDDRDKALALSMGERIRSLRRSLQLLGDRLERRHPARVLASLRNRLTQHQRRMDTAIRLLIRQRVQRIDGVAARLADRHPRHGLGLLRQRLTSAEARLHAAAAAGLLDRRQRLEAVDRQLQAVGPEQVLRRGFSLTTSKRTGEIIRSATQITPGVRYVTRFGEGEVEWTAEDPRQPRLFQ